MKAIAQQIEKATAKKDVRAYLNEPFFDGKRIIATDGHIMAFAKARPDASDPHKDDRGHVPAEILKAARKKNSPVRLNGKAEAPECGLSLPRPDLGDFIKTPDLARIVRRARKGKTVLKINAELLLRLAQAVTDAKSKHANIIELRIGDTNSPVFVRGLYSDAAGYGVIMPCR